MPPVTETEMKELRDLVLGLREEMRIGFVEIKAELKGEIQRVEAKTDTKFADVTVAIANLSGELKGEMQRVEAKTDAKFADVSVAIANLSGDIKVLEERTKIGFWGFIWRALIVSSFGLAVSFAAKYFFFGTVKI
jgi:hypothetical protein